MTTARAHELTAPRPSGEAASRRPVLRVVDTRRDGSHRSLLGVIGTLLTVVLFAGVFSVITFQVLLVQAQSQLDDLGAHIDGQVVEQKQMNHDIANLESPDRIVTEARDHLGMVTPESPGYLQPQAGDDARAGLSAGGP
jgi:cell division protein FtsL